MFNFNVVEIARKRAQDAVEAAKAAAAAPSAPSASEAPAGPDWDEVDRTIEAAMEHAGISSVDVQVDGNGFATIRGVVTSEEDRDTIASLVENFQVTGVDLQIEIVEPEPIPEAPPAPADATIEYTVKKGESWWGIAARHYGDGTLHAALKAHNGSPRMLHPGHVIKLPPKAELAGA